MMPDINWITRYKYLAFVLIEDDKKSMRKTFIYEVKHKVSNERLGTVKWFAPWRQYCFIRMAKQYSVTLV